MLSRNITILVLAVICLDHTVLPTDIVETEVDPVADIVCEIETDLEPPHCMLEDLSDQVLIDICNRIGYDDIRIEEDMLHDEFATQAWECLQFEKKTAQLQLRNGLIAAMKDMVKNSGIVDKNEKRNIIRQGLSKLPTLKTSKNRKIVQALLIDALNDNPDNEDISYISIALEYLKHISVKDKVMEAFQKFQDQDGLNEIINISEDLLQMMKVIEDSGAAQKEKDGDKNAFRDTIDNMLKSPDFTEDQKEFLPILSDAMTNKVIIDSEMVLDFALTRLGVSDDERALLKLLMDVSELKRREKKLKEEEALAAKGSITVMPNEYGWLYQLVFMLFVSIPVIFICIRLNVILLDYGRSNWGWDKRQTLAETIKTDAGLKRFIIDVLRIPITYYHVQIVTRTIYVWSSNKLTGNKKHRKKKKGASSMAVKDIISKSSVMDVQIGTKVEDILVGSTLFDDHIPVHLTGDRQAIKEAIILIKDVVGIQNVIETFKKPTSSPVKTDDKLPSLDATISSSISDHAIEKIHPEEEASADKPEPISIRRSKRNRIQKNRGQDDNIDTSEATSIAESVGDDESNTHQNDPSIQATVHTSQSLDEQNIDTSLKTGEEKTEKEHINEQEAPTEPSTTIIQEEKEKTANGDSSVIIQEEGKEIPAHDDGSAKAAVSKESAPVLLRPDNLEKEVVEEEVPSEIDLTQDLSREVTSVISNVSKMHPPRADTNFTLNEEDPLLIFLRTQESCIKGSVDDFYTWLVESEDIDSMTALKEAVCDDNYLNNTMKKGNGSSGLKGFKREVFQSAVISECSDTKPVLLEDILSVTEDVHLPQDEKKLSMTNDSSFEIEANSYLPTNLFDNTPKKSTTDEAVTANLDDQCQALDLLLPEDEKPSNIGSTVPSSVLEKEDPEDDNKTSPPDELVCPISLNLMTEDPVVASDGITYERSSIEDWFKKSKAKISEAEENLRLNPHSEADQRVVDKGICSPLYKTKMRSLTLVPNASLRNMSCAYKEKKSGVLTKRKIIRPPPGFE